MPPESLNGARAEHIRGRLAAYLLSTKLEERLLPVRELASQHQTSVGLISSCLHQLESDGAVTIARHGRMGSFLTKKSIGKLWYAAENGPMVIAFTLPSNRRYEGLATALKRQLDQIGIEAYFIFIRGSRTRYKALRENRCHVAVMSAFAAAGLCTHREAIALELPDMTFVTSHRVFYRDEPGSRVEPLRVAIDPDSFDQERLTTLEFNGVPTVTTAVNFMQFHRVLEEGLVDFAVWTLDDRETHPAPSIMDRPLSARVRQEIGSSDTRAALLIRVENASLTAVLKEAINTAELLETQRRVLADELVPEY